VEGVIDEFFDALITNHQQNLLANSADL